MAFENYTVNQFENAWFKQDRSVMDEETFLQVYNEYLDTSGLYNQDEYNKVSYIEFLSGRINTINISNRLQRQFLEEFGIPVVAKFDVYQKYGYFLLWNDNKEEFLKKLEDIELQEKMFVSELENCIKELGEQRQKKNVKEISLSQTRRSFITTRNSLNKIGYQIDVYKTTVEEYSLMIYQQIEDNQRIEQQLNKSN